MIRQAIRLAGGVSLVAVLGCVNVEYLNYRGEQQWPTGSAFVHSIDALELYEGLPDRPYEVIGMVDVYDDEPFYQNDSVRAKVIGLAHQHHADAMIWLSDRVIISGSLKMGTTERDPASLDTGRSSQPEVIVTHVSESIQSSYEKSLRSSILLIRWKAGS